MCPSHSHSCLHTEPDVEHMQTTPTLPFPQQVCLQKCTMLFNSCASHNLPLTNCACSCNAPPAVPLLPCCPHPTLTPTIHAQVHLTELIEDTHRRNTPDEVERAGEGLCVLCSVCERCLAALSPSLRSYSFSVLLLSSVRVR